MGFRAGAEVHPLKTIECNERGWAPISDERSQTKHNMRKDAAKIWISIVCKDLEGQL